MPKPLAWLLWSALCLVIVGAFLPSTQPVQGFLGQSGRILFFHVPCAWVSFLAFVVAGVWSARFLAGGRKLEHDRKAALSIGLGMMFGIVATLSGAVWAKVQWGAYWNWDPRQTSITLVLLFYGAYLALRNAIEDNDTRGRLSAAYALLGLVVAPFCYFVLPRITFTLHPEPVINSAGKVEMESQMLAVLLGGVACFTVLFFWLLSLADRIARRAEPARFA